MLDISGLFSSLRGARQHFVLTQDVSLLWLTWFLVTLFDVRFVTDSIFCMSSAPLSALVMHVRLMEVYSPRHQSHPAWGFGRLRCGCAKVQP